MRQNSKGDYVLHSDYAELEAGVAEVFRMVHYHRADWTDIDAALERLMRLTSETGDDVGDESHHLGIHGGDLG